MKLSFGFHKIEKNFEFDNDLDDVLIERIDNKLEVNMENTNQILELTDDSEIYLKMINDMYFIFIIKTGNCFDIIKYLELSFENRRLICEDVDEILYTEDSKLIMKEGNEVCIIDFDDINSPDDKNDLINDKIIYENSSGMLIYSENKKIFSLYIIIEDVLIDKIFDYNSITNETKLNDIIDNISFKTVSKIVQMIRTNKLDNEKLSSKIIRIKQKYQTWYDGNI
jgi:hypothetical protein